MPNSRSAAASTEIVAGGSTEVDSETFRRFLAAAEEDVTEQDPEQVQMDIIARILNATTASEVLGGGGATHARDFLDKPFALTGVRFNKSTVNGAGPAFYALLEGADDDGVKVLITCGARSVIAQAWKLRDLGALPARVQLHEADKPTAAGFKPIWLETVAASF